MWIEKIFFAIEKKILIIKKIALQKCSNMKLTSQNKVRRKLQMALVAYTCRISASTTALCLLLLLVI